MAILDARLTLGLPVKATAATGIDAMVHAIESYTSKKLKNPLSDMLAVKALTLLSTNLLRACGNGNDLAAREAMLLGAMLAGQAFANSPVARSEEHTSELQTLLRISYAAFCLKKKN